MITTTLLTEVKKANLQPESSRSKQKNHVQQVVWAI